MPVMIVRIVFLGLLLADGIGLLLYLILDLAMPVHPDDRQYMWRFRLRRWWASRRNEHEAVQER